MPRIIGLLPPLVLLLLATAAPARTWHVPAEVATIAGACGQAAAGDTVLIACGGYAERDIVVPAGIVLRSESGSPDCVVIDAQASGRDLICDGADGTTVEGLLLLGGMGDGGGCVRIAGGDPHFVNCEFSAGVSFSGGGGVSCTDGAAPVFDDCNFLGNQSVTSSGGGLLAVDATPVLRGCLFRGNLCGSEGGGMYVDQGGLDLTDCTFVDNRTNNYGGGLIAYASAGTLTGCEFRQNLAESGGGGAHVAWAPVTFDGCRFTGNEAIKLWGGGLSTGGYDVITLTDCTFDGNLAPSAAAIKGGSDLALTQCTITGNTASASVGGVSLNGGLNLTADHCLIRDNVGAAPADGFVPVGSTAQLHCCDIVMAAWLDWDAITVDYEGCGVPSARTTWGGLKSQFR